MPDFPSPTLIAAPLFVLAIAWEWWAVATGRARGKYESKDAFASMAMGIGNVVVNTLTATVTFLMLVFFWRFRIAELPFTWWSILTAFLLYDFVYYWKHRFAHRVRWFWMEHVTHHSSQHYNLTTAVRQPWFGPFTGLILLGAPLVILGFHPALLALVGGLNLVYQFWIHTEAIDRLPRWVEFIFNTPSHHRVHHATHPMYLDRNYAGVFIIWDRLFGTFTKETSDLPMQYGIVKPLASYNPLIVAYHEGWGLARDCVSDGLRPHIWLARASQPPGWSPDGKHQRSEDILRAYEASTSPKDETAKSA